MAGAFPRSSEHADQVSSPRHQPHRGDADRRDPSRLAPPPDRKSGLLWGSEIVAHEEAFRDELALQVRHPVVDHFERLVGGPLFGSLSGERLIEALPGERLFPRRYSQVQT